MKKQIPAFVAATLMTILIAMVMVVTGANALYNKNTAVVVDSSVSAKNAAVAISVNDQATIQALQNRINEYAAREQQYQQREQQLQQTIQSDQEQVQQAALQVKQIQRLLGALQDRGLITVQSDGSIMINR